jgi:hypothetical protein
LRAQAKGGHDVDAHARVKSSSLFLLPSPPPVLAGKYSFGNPWQLNEALQAGVVGKEILNTYNATIQFCKCMLIDHTGSVYCDLQGIRGAFFAISVLIVGLYEGSTAVKGMRSPAVRLAVSVATILMYISIIVIMSWKGETCNSYMLYIDLRVIYSLALASLVIILIFTTVEACVWIRALKMTRKERRGRTLLKDSVGDTSGESGLVAGGGTGDGSEEDSADEAARTARSDSDEDEGDYISLEQSDAPYLLYEDGSLEQATSI